MSTKTLKVKQLVSAKNTLYALVDDGSVWQLADGNDWIELPSIEVEENSSEDE